ncbi:MAG: PIG-L family deacetylase [Elusimicrobia bacterium]|nr:PIG-L family deacetylase [Elusimicrobiota bacterium]
MKNVQTIVHGGSRVGTPVQVYRAVILSPHWDVFSAGGHMVHLQKEGRVLVLNLFTGYPENVKAWGVVAQNNRDAEERAVAAKLGFESRTLGEKDAVCRESTYRAPSRLFGDPLPSDIARLPALKAHINDFLSRISFESLYIPLAVGWHVDHQMAHMAAEDWWDDPRTLFYEDMPYALVPNFTIYRLRELGILPGTGGSLWGAVLRTGVGFSGMAPIQNINVSVRWGAGLVAGLFLARQLAKHRRRWISRGHRWDPVVEHISDTAHCKREAAFRYASQVGEYFRGREGTPTAAVLGNIERFWEKTKDP